ncbi:MAG: DNA polymerase III subunit epsilon [Gammaproteobacteria bacterium CG11_big_fil_rev_8_21_14_0_20_46_22]|nr:MAG: DNA polymerase III subunit epsilon [Gammaproteobacteria bacterium CG12_big_fil_rev_8_21_14_0_65_46_12]PIR12015.1 MAG: DNA polymerase III subunit epsilon [Gammaproteobacteria bacterium CG11_big_fil_rev_8_21_14_0_20_46_22]
MTRQIILDTETTGLSFKEGHRVIEIGGIEMINRRLTNNHFHYYINPEREVEAEALAVHGITNEFLQDKPVFSDVAKAFFDFVDGAELVIHNAPFDVGFLDFELGRVSRQYPKLAQCCTIFDTLVLARQQHPGQRNSLDALCKRYGVDNTDRELHGALLDAKILAQVYLAMTGGQVALFTDGHKQSQGGESAATTQQQRTVGELAVVNATAQELDEHEAYLKRLEKNGADLSLWH